jgi:DNA modification methylase
MKKTIKRPALVWSTAKRRLGDLVPHALNPRTASEEFRKKLTEMLQKFGLAEIPAVDLDGTILAGHQRIAVLLGLYGSDYIIEVRIPSRRLTGAERKTYLLASNRLHADWDWTALSENFDINDLLLSGFDDNDLSHIFDDSLSVEDDDWDEEKELEKIKIPTVKPGDLLQLGDHRLLCADATDERMVRKLVGNTRIDFVDVDAPFNIKYSYKGKNGKYGGIEKDDKTSDEYRVFMHSLVRNSIAVSKDSAHYIFWCDERWVWLLQELYRELGIESKRLCIWVKDNSMPTPKVAFNKATEFAVYGSRGTPFINDQIKNLNTILNREVGSGARVLDDIVDLYSIWLAKRLPAALYEHPTQKPPSLHEKALRRCTRPGDAVLDLTAGSGSLMVACEQMKRKSFLCEVDPIFATLIKNRYEKISGKKARAIN